MTKRTFEEYSVAKITKYRLVQPCFGSGAKLLTDTNGELGLCVDDEKRINLESEKVVVPLEEYLPKSTIKQCAMKKVIPYIDWLIDNMYLDENTGFLTYDEGTLKEACEVHGWKPASVQTQFKKFHGDHKNMTNCKRSLYRFKEKKACIDEYTHFRDVKRQRDTYSEKCAFQDGYIYKEAMECLQNNKFDLDKSKKAVYEYGNENNFPTLAIEEVRERIVTLMETLHAKYQEAQEAAKSQFPL